MDAAPPPLSHGAPRTRRDLAKLAIGALGVVYGDIGTSPLYAIKECFAKHNDALGRPLDRLARSDGNVLGILSLVFWSLVLVIVVKYLTFIMRADNEGEGGILALLALVAKRKDGKPRGFFLIAARPLRRGAPLRRRDHHAGHLGPVGDRGPRSPSDGRPRTGRRIDAPREPRRAAHGPHPRGALRRAEAWDGARRLDLRAGDVRVVLLHRGDRHRRGRRAPEGAARHPADARSAVPAPPRDARVPRARLGRPLHHGRRGALRRHGPLRTEAHPCRLVRARASRRSCSTTSGKARCCSRRAARSR